MPRIRKYLCSGSGPLDDRHMARLPLAHWPHMHDHDSLMVEHCTRLCCAIAWRVSQYEGFVELPARDVGRRKAIYVEAHIETDSTITGVCQSIKQTGCELEEASQTKL